MVSIGVNEKRLGEKNIEQRKKLSKNLSQALVGTTGQIAVGIILGSLGFLTGAEPEDDKEKEAWRMLGKQAYSIYIPNVGSFSIDWMQPIAAGLTVGAQISQTGGDVSKISEAMLESMFQNSVAESLSKLFGYRTWTDRVQYLGSNAVLQHFPSITRSIANAIDPYERDIYQGTALQILANRMLTAIPGASYLVPPKVDVWGNPISKSDMGYGFAGRMLQVLAPFRMRTENMDSTSKNVIDLFEETGKVEVLPRLYSDTLTVKGVKYEMNGDQYAEFQQLAGSEAKRLVDQVTSNPEFKDMTPEMKAKILDKMYDRAGKTARTTIFNRYFAK